MEPEALTQKVVEALQLLRKEKERKFTQTVDLIINLQKIDLKRTSLNLFTSVPYKIKEKSIGAFLEVKRKDIETVTKDELPKFNDKKKLKTFVDKFDFFIAQASLMPKVATTFGKVLGPAGKMPSPQLGILMNVDDKQIQELKQKINTSVKIKVKEASVKLAIGKTTMKDTEIAENVSAVYSALMKALPRDKENIKNVEIKFTMTKPIKIAIR